MIVDGINLIDGVISNATVESGTTLPVTNLVIGRLFFLTQLDGASSPGLYIYNGTQWESSGETGDIESVIASTGLLGGGNSGDVTLEVDTSFVATKTITDGLEANKLNKAGDTMTGNLNMGTNVIGSLGNPVDPADATNKQYVDNLVSSIDFTPYVEKTGSSLTGDLVFGASNGIRFGDLALNTEIRDNVVEGTPSLQINADNTPVADVFSSGISLRAGRTLTLAQDPTLNLQAATKQYVDSEIAAIDYSAFLQKSGGTMTGSLILDADPSLNLEAATKQYVDSQISTLGGSLDGDKVNKSGDTMTGFLTLHANPTLAFHASTKEYVDDSISNIDYSPYLQVAGGTITGNLVVQGSAVFESATMNLGEGLKFTESADYFGTAADARIIELVDTNGTTGAVDGGLVIRGYAAGDDTSRELLVIRSTNAGGDPIGDTFTWRGNEIWHAGNDGSGSGLDADTVDGIQGSDIVRKSVASTMTAPLTLNGNPTANLHAATKQYVDTASSNLNASKVDLAGDTMTGFLTLHADPVSTMHAVTKQYVDNIATGLDFKQSCRALASSNITLSGVQTIDGVSLVAGNRVLVVGQTNATQNGIYVVASGAWARSEDADGTPANEVSPGMFTFVEEGTTWANSSWVLATNGTINLGTTPLSFTRFSGTGQIEAGNGLLKTGNTLSIGPGSGIQVDVDGVSLFGSDPRNANHDNISMVAGNGLTGGGAINSTRTFNVGAGTGITVGTDTVGLDTANTRNVDHSSVSILGGTGLTGGGDLTANRTITLDTADTRNVDHSAVSVTAGAGLTGGGTIAATRTINVGAGTGITVGADSVGLNLTYTDGRYVQHPTNVITATSMTAVPNQNVFVDTRSGQVTVNLPSSPVIGDQVTIIDVYGNFGVNKCVVGRNGQVIMSLPENMDITTSNASVTLIYSQGSTGWRIKY